MLSIAMLIKIPKIEKSTPLSKQMKMLLGYISLITFLTQILIYTPKNR